VNPLNPLYDAVAWVIIQIHAAIGHVVSPGSGLAWVLSIVVLVVLMRLVLLPLFIKQMHSMRKMSALAPQMQELRKKYKNDKQTMNEETMKLYRENGVNPLGGCLPLVAQLPLFFALFGVLRAISDWTPVNPTTHRTTSPPYGFTAPLIHSAQHANILGATISDKVLFTGTEHVPVHAKLVILGAVAISVITTFLTVRQSTKRGMNPGMTPDNPMAASQKYMMYIVPFFALSGLYWQFGLVFYWVTTNVWTLGQQHLLFKRYPPAAQDGTAGTAAASGAVAVTGAGPVPAPKTAGPKPPKSAVRKQVPAKPGAPTAAAGTAAGQRKPASTAAPGDAAPGSAVNGTAAASPGPGSPAAPKSASARSAAKSAPLGGPSGTGSPSSAKPRAVAPSTPPRRPAAAPADGATTVPNGAGLLRRLGVGRQAEEEQPQAPEVKIVRQQRVRQSRSKRSGKR
jgi:YidC/Oxa1 family membrane protein insertase